MISKGGRYISASILDLLEAFEAPPVASAKDARCDDGSSWFQIDDEMGLWLKIPGRPRLS